MTVYDSKITSVNNDTSDDNEKVRKPLLNNGSPNNKTISSTGGSPQALSNIGEEEKFIGGENRYGLEEVKDSYNLIYFVFLLFGIATLLPWNVFITAEDVGFILFDFKHPNNCLTNKLL